MATCGSCYGKGKVRCPSCNGSGSLSQSSDESGPGVTCTLCDGNGFSKCLFCGGNGYIGLRSTPSDYLDLINEKNRNTIRLAVVEENKERDLAGEKRDDNDLNALMRDMLVSFN